MSDLSHVKGAAVIGFVAAFIVGVGVGLTISPRPTSYTPLALIPAGTSLAGNHWGIGQIQGDVTAEIELAVFLVDGHRTVTMPNRRISQPCGQRDPFAGDQEEPLPCQEVGMIWARGSSIRLEGLYIQWGHDAMNLKDIVITWLTIGVGLLVVYVLLMARP